MDGLTVILVGSALVAVWTGLDARKRKSGYWPAWALGALVCLIIALPIYLACRPLYPEETRTGGRPWQALKNFVLIWAAVLITYVSVALTVIFALPGGKPGTTHDLVAIAFTVSAFSIAFFLWIVPATLALVIGLLMRRSDKIEYGSNRRHSVGFNTARQT